MERQRRRKVILIITLMLVISGLTIGFAAFTSVLTISSSATVTPNESTFSVKFSTNKDNLVVSAVKPSSKTSDITTTDGIIDNSASPTIKNLSATFTNPGQYVEYIFYARNEGEYLAYLNDINFVGNKTCIGDTGATTSLVQSACESINITATVGDKTYNKTTQIIGHTLEKKKGEQIKVRLEYESGGAYVDGSVSISFPNITLIYSTLDNNPIPDIDPSIPDVPVTIVKGSLDEAGSEVCIGEECFYIISSTEETVTMLAKYNLHVGNICTNSNTCTPLSNPTGIQDETAKGYIVNENGTVIYPFIGTTEFSNDVKSYSGSIIEGYVNEYSSYFETQGVEIIEARLISSEEVHNLGCNTSYDNCTTAPEWVYSTSYWYDYIETDEWHIGGEDRALGRVIRSDNHINYLELGYNNEGGVRPVITISKSEF